VLATNALTHTRVRWILGMGLRRARALGRPLHAVGHALQLIQQHSPAEQDHVGQQLSPFQTRRAGPTCVRGCARGARECVRARVCVLCALQVLVAAS
jgi:hypothetical protein